MLVSTRGGSSTTPGSRGDAVGEDPGVVVVLLQPPDHLGQREDARRRDDARLAHAAAEDLPHPPGAVDERRRAADHRPDRRGEPFRQAELHRRDVPRPVGDRPAGRDRRVEQPRAVEVNRQVVAGGDGRDRREVLGRQNRAAAPVVRVLEADHAGRRVVVEVVVVRGRLDGGLERVERQRAVRVGAEPGGARGRPARTPIRSRSGRCATRRRE